MRKHAKELQDYFMSLVLVFFFFFCLKVIDAHKNYSSVIISD